MWKKILLGAGSVLLGLYLLFQVGYYATSGPSFCASCHEVEQYVTSWEDSSHSNINCLQCHQPNGELGKIHAKARGLNYVIQHFSGDYTIPTQAQIFEQNCIQCHLGDDENQPNATKLANTDKVNHYATIKNSQSCLECHREAGHAVDIYLSPDLKGMKSMDK